MTTKFWLGAALALAPLVSRAQTPQNRFTAALANKDAHIKVTPKEAEKRVDIEIDGKPFTSYQWGGGFQRPALYPIYSPKQNFVTRGYPIASRPHERVDFPNQTGLWLAYGNVNGIDYWNDEKNPSPTSKGPYGTIRHKAIKSHMGGKVLGKLSVESEWVAPTGKVVLQEVADYVFEGSATDRVITRTTTLTAMEDAMFADDRDGLLGLRLARELEHPYKAPLQLTGADGRAVAESPGTSGNPNGTFVNSEQIKDDSTYGKRAEWVLLNGQLGSEPVSVAFLDHPQNLGHPTYWNVRGSGLFAANPMGQAFFSRGQEALGLRIPKGKSLTFKHRIRIQSGRQLTEADCEKVFTQFANPVEEEE